MKTKIDFLTVVYKNYDLIDLQIDNFRKKFTKDDYNLVVVDNTPISQRQLIKENDVISKVITVNKSFQFDGLSHGNAINEGLLNCNSKIVCIFDSDFFFLKNVIDYVHEKFEQGYKAVGAEWNDGCDTFLWTEKFPDMFKNIPCCFGCFYDIDLAKKFSWAISPDEVNENLQNGFVEVGFRHRKYILENNIKTLAWKGRDYAPPKGNCFFWDENNDKIAYHLVEGSIKQNLNTFLEEIL